MIKIKIQKYFDGKQVVASRIMCKATSLLENFLQQIINNNGEGVIMRKPHTLYERGRSTSLVKLKVLNREKERESKCNEE